MSKVNIRRFNLDKNLQDCLQPVADLLNAVAENRSSANIFTTTAIPTSTQGFSNGDFYPIQYKALLGAPGSQYVLQGWDLVDIGGTLGWVERRTLTGT